MGFPSQDKLCHLGEGVFCLLPLPSSQNQNTLKFIKQNQNEAVELMLESFSIDTQNWEVYGTFKFIIDKEKFAEGGFREAFKAKEAVSRKYWVLKQYKEDVVKNMKDTLSVSPEQHARKQVQMHSVARNVAQRFTKKAPLGFGETFTYHKVYYASLIMIST